MGTLRTLANNPTARDHVSGPTCLGWKGGGSRAGARTIGGMGLKETVERQLAPRIPSSRPG